MRFLIILATSSVLCWLFAELLSVGASKALLAYIGWLGAATLTAYFAARFVPPTELSYRVFFCITLCPAMLLALIVAVKFTCAMPSLESGVSLIIVSMMYPTFLVLLLYRYVPHVFVTDLRLSQGWLFSVCGAIAFASLIPPHSLIEHVIRFSLGLYWTAIGSYAFCESLGLLRARVRWVKIADVTPQLIGLACFALFALLVAMQGESSRQQIRGQHVELAPVESEVR